MLLNRGPLWRQGSRPQPVNQAQDLGEQGPRDGNLGHLERDVATVADHLGTDLDELVAERGQRPVLYLLRQRQCPHMAISGLSGHVASTSALPPTADIRMPMSAFALIASASPPGADLYGDAPVRLLLTRRRLSRCWTPSRCHQANCRARRGVSQQPAGVVADHLLRYHRRQSGRVI